jgi:hypothetical protein
MGSKDAIVTKQEDIIDEPQLPFVTTSNVLNQLNTPLQTLNGAEEFQQPPRFELQKCLPDGSANMPASDIDL